MKPAHLSRKGSDLQDSGSGRFEARKNQAVGAGTSTRNMMVIRNDMGPVGEYITSRLVTIIGAVGSSVVVEAPEEPFSDRFASGTEDPSGIVIGGSLHCVNDALPWIRREEWFVREAIRRRIPILGICFGAQLIAKALGGEVGRSRLTGGSQRIERLANCCLLDDVTNLNFLVSHEDHIKRLPQGFQPTATSEYCAVQAFRSNSTPVFGVQFHPCYDEGVLAVKQLACVAEHFRANVQGEKMIQRFVQRCIDFGQVYSAEGSVQRESDNSLVAFGCAGARNSPHRRRISKIA